MSLQTQIEEKLNESLKNKEKNLYPTLRLIVSGIKVDVTDKTADLARKKALRIGEAQAFLTLLKRLTMRIDHTRLPVLNEDEISGYLQEFKYNRSNRYFCAYNRYF